MKKIIVIGSGGHAKVVIDILHEMNSAEIHGIISPSLPSGTNFFGYKILGDDEILKKLSCSEYLIAMGIGGFRDNNLRTNLYLKIKNEGFSFINPIHPKAIISRSSIIGESVTIFPGAIINTEVNIGNNSIIATGASIDHETTIGDNVLISAGVTIGAYVNIKDNALLALGSKVVSGIIVGEKSLVAAGAVVVNNVDDNEIVLGIPAKKQ